MIKYIQKQEYESRTKTFSKERVEHVTFNFTLENQVHRQGYYFNDKWVAFYAGYIKSVHTRVQMSFVFF